ncbi:MULTISPECIES: hypothetical protein [Streptomyces]|uniref:Secreted protein n=1 Tax=Streptomyces dengpaensis TaxID=2049881 RepID=A0ABN5HVZ9_9ACTN|nr:MULTISPECIES: hypothetical protein [Streptomyces]AVH55311.1 hypothetical protein C4B68_05365 [Streptomyces dengpaensis]PIB06956.1 hypothetical protein B1C81_21520 [Streptomyces sp. HG99]
MKPLRFRQTTRALAVVALAGSTLAVFTPPAQAADPLYSGSRVFDVAIPGARYQGTLTWWITGDPQLIESVPPTTHAQIAGLVSDTAPDDARAVAYVAYETVPYERNCVDFGQPPPLCTFDPDESRRQFNLPQYVGDATPNGATRTANWSHSEEGGQIENAQVVVCIEQWRYDPDRVITCSDGG